MNAMDETLAALLAHLARTSGWCSSMSLGEARLRAAELGVGQGKLDKFSGSPFTFYALPNQGKTYSDYLSQWNNGIRR